MPLYLGNKLVTQIGLGSRPVGLVDNKLYSALPAQGSIVTYMDASNYTSGDKWYATIGNITGSLNGSGSILPTYSTDSGGTFTFSQYQTLHLTGSTSLNYVDSSQYTVVYAGRFAGTAGDYHGRTLNSLGKRAAGNTTNWQMGPENSGGTNYTTAFYNGTYYVYGPANSTYDTTWRIYTAVGANTNSGFYLNGEVLTSGSSGNQGFNGLGINTGSFCNGTAGGGSNNTCAVGDIIVYNKALTPDEVRQVFNAFRSNYNL